MKPNAMKPNTMKPNTMKPSALPSPDRGCEAAAWAHQNQLTKPPGSLGRLEAIAVQMAAFQKTARPTARPATVLIFAADHPVTRHGISPYPSDVTRAMLQNFADGGAAASVLARQRELPLHVIDVGVDGAPSVPPSRSGPVQVLRVKERLEAGDIRTEDALTVDGFARCVQAGRSAVEQLARGHRVLLLGEMGIGNTTPAAAIASLLIHPADPAALVGQGTGATGDVLESKRAVVRDIVRRLARTTDPIEILRRAGGRELAALYGAMVAALENRVLVIVDGFIVTAVAAALVRAHPEALAGMIFAHCSDERGHAALLEHLRARPLLDLGMRLGEASGALAAYPLVEAACALHTQMATFAAAAIPKAEP